VILRSALFALLDALAAIFLVLRARSTHDLNSVRPVVHLGLVSLLVSGRNLLLVGSTSSRVRHVVVQRRVGSHADRALGRRKLPIRIRRVIDMAQGGLRNLHLLSISVTGCENLASRQHL
jgi:hypothetical protein